MEQASTGGIRPPYRNMQHLEINFMTKLTRSKGQELIVIGMIALAAMAIFLRFHIDFGAGVGLGISIPTLILGLISLKQS